MPDQKRQLAFRGLIITAAALIALAVLATVLTIVGLHGDAMQDAERDAGSVATVLAEQTSRSVQSIDRALTELQGRVAASGVATAEDLRTAFGGEDTFRLLREEHARLSEADAITLVGADGMVVNSSRAFPPRAIDLSDRDYFRRARDAGRAAAESVYVSVPLTNRYTGLRAVVLSRRLESAAGTFLGVALVNVDIAYFRHVYESVSALTDSSFLFLRRDGVVLVRHPDPQSRTGDLMPADSPWYGLVAAGGGYFRTPGVFDGIPRIV